jgi:hypothetical protein
VPAFGPSAHKGKHDIGGAQAEDPPSASTAPHSARTDLLPSSNCNKSFAAAKSICRYRLALVRASRELRERAETRVREEIAARERERLRVEAQTQLRKLFEDVENWSKAKVLYQFIERFEEEVRKSSSECGEFAGRWLIWAKNHVARIITTSKIHGQNFAEEITRGAW